MTAHVHLLAEAPGFGNAEFETVFEMKSPLTREPILRVQVGNNTGAIRVIVLDASGGLSVGEINSMWATAAGDKQRWGRRVSSDSHARNVEVIFATRGDTENVKVAV